MTLGSGHGHASFVIFEFRCMLIKTTWKYCGKIFLVPPIRSVLILKLYLQRASHPENHTAMLALLAVRIWNSWSLL